MTAWIQTFSGIAWNLEAPRADDVRLVDIAHALARICRFTGHTRGDRIYSVAQHSVLVATYVELQHPELYLAALLHDAHEAYLGDISRPLGTLLPGFAELKRAHDRVIAEWAGIAPTDFQHPAVREADAVMLATEANTHLPDGCKGDWGDLPPPWEGACVAAWSVSDAERELTARIEQATNEDGDEP